MAYLISGGAMKTADAEAAGAMQTIRANKFIVEDENGKTRGMLATDKDGPMPRPRNTACTGPESGAAVTQRSRTPHPALPTSPNFQLRAL